MSTSDVSEYIWHNFDQQHVDFPEPAMERMIESKFKRKYVTYLMWHFGDRVISLDDKFELPNDSILHVADNFEHFNEPIDIPRLEENLFVQNESFLKYILHIRDFNKTGPIKYPDKYIYRQAGLPSVLMKFRSEHGGAYKYLNTFDDIPKRDTALTIINHNPLFRIRMFGRMQTYRRVMQILASIFNTAVELARLDKNQFIVLPWGEEHYTISNFIRNRDQLTYSTIKYPENLQYIFMMHLVNYFWPTASTSMFSKLDPSTLNKIYLVLKHNDKYIFYNLAALKALDDDNRVYKKMFNQLNLLAVMGRPGAVDNPVVKDLITKMQKVEKLDDSGRLEVEKKPLKEEKEDTVTNSEGNVVGKSTVTVYTPATKEVVAATPEAKESVITTIIQNIANAVSPTRDIPKFHGASSRSNISIKVPDAHATVIDAATKKETTVTVKRAANITKLNTEIIKEDVDDFMDTLDKEADDFIDNRETLTPNAKRYFKNVAKKYKKLTLGGVPLEKLLRDQSDLTLSDTTIDPAKLGPVTDMSSIKSTLVAYDQDYIKKTYPKHIAGIISSFQKNGVYLVGLKEEKVLTELHNYTEYSCQYEDLDGKKSTIKFKIPNIDSEGCVTIDGVKQVVKKQRFPLPIIKISEDTVALSSNYNKARVQRCGNKAHDFASYIHRLMVDKSKCSVRIAYGNEIVNLPLAYEYTVLATKYRYLSFVGRDNASYDLCFSYKRRHKHFDGKPEMLDKLEGQYGVYFGKTKDNWLFADNTNTVSVISKTKGEVSTGTSIMDVCKMALTSEAYNKTKPLSEWTTIQLLDGRFPVIFMLAYRFGLRNILDYLGVKYTITENRAKTIVGESDVTNGEVQAGTEAFVRDKISGDIPGYDPDLANYDKDTVICYEGIWTDNFKKQDPHGNEASKATIQQISNILARIAKKYDKGLNDQEIVAYLKEHLYTKGHRLVLSKKDVQRLNDKYGVDPSEVGLIGQNVINYNYTCKAASFGKSLIPAYEQMFQDEEVDMNVVKYIRNELYDHEVFLIDNLTEMLLTTRARGIPCSEEYIDGILQYYFAHEEGHSAAPKEITDECLKNHTFDAHEAYADKCALAALTEWSKKHLNDKEESENIPNNPKIEDTVSQFMATGGTLVGLEAMGRMVKPRLGSVTLYLTNKSESDKRISVTIRAVVITVNLGTTTSVQRQVTAYNGSTFITTDKDKLPRDMVDKLANYFNCGKTKISHASVNWLSSDKVLPPGIAKIRPLSAVEHNKLASKIKGNFNKVRLGKRSGTEDFSVGFEDISEEVRYVPKPNDIHIKFADRVLHINRYPLAHSLIVAGLCDYDLTKYEMSEFESSDVYYRLLSDKKMSINLVKGINSFYDLFVDNITYSVLKMMHEPTNVKDLLIRSTVLLSTTDHEPPSSGYNHRLRGYEQFAGILYNELARSFATYQSKHNASNKFSTNPDSVYLRIVQNGSMIPAESGSPIEDIKRLSGLTYGGIQGRTDDSFVVRDRHYEASDVGIVSESTVDNKKAGFNNTVTFNPNIINTLGMAADTPIEKLEPSQVLSIHALTFPFSCNDDTKRINFIQIQCAHLVPVECYEKMRVCTGYERVLAHRCGRNFAGVAKQKGKITNVDERARLVEVTYANGDTEVFPFGSEYITFDSMELESRLECNVKVGQVVDKGDIITYNRDYFKMDKTTGQVDMSIGVKSNVVFMEMDTTLEDGVEISDRLATKLTMSPINLKVVSLSGKSLIHMCRSIGDVVAPTDDLMIFEEDPTATGSFNVDEDTLLMLSELNRRTPSAGHAGTIVKIDAYYSCDPEVMHPTVKELVKHAVEERNRRYRMTRNSANENDYPPSTMIAPGSKYKGVTFSEDTVMFVFHIQEHIKHGVGDKLVVCNQLKCTCGGIFAKPVYSESGVEIDAFFSMLSTNKRIVLSPFMHGITSRILEKLEDDICLEYFGEPR